jgi:hypothetical protein
MCKKNNQEQEKINVIQWPCLSGVKEIAYSQTMIPQIDLEGFRAILCENQSARNDLYE